MKLHIMLALQSAVGYNDNTHEVFREPFETIQVGLIREAPTTGWSCRPHRRASRGAVKGKRRVGPCAYRPDIASSTRWGDAQECRDPMCLERPRHRRINGSGGIDDEINGRGNDVARCAVGAFGANERRIAEECVIGDCEVFDTRDCHAKPKLTYGCQYRRLRRAVECVPPQISGC